jgi:hypothetical protein
MDGISADVVDKSRQALFKAHAVVAVAAAAAVSEMPVHPQFMQYALDVAAEWVMEALDLLDFPDNGCGAPSGKGCPRC